MFVSFRSTLDYSERDIAQEALFEGWPDDDRVVADALEALGPGRLQYSIDRDLAVSYLLQTKPGRPAVKEWMLEELGGEYAFILGGAPWQSMPRHCHADPEVQNAVVAYILRSGDRYRDNYFNPVVEQVHDLRLRDYAAAQVRREGLHYAYWSLLPLLRGWRDDVGVQQLIAEVLAWPDDRLDMVVDLLPVLYDTSADARDRLLQVARNAANPRLDLIIGALSTLGSTGRDVEAVETLLPRVAAAKVGMGRPDQFYLAFASHPKVLEAAHRRLDEPEVPIALLARAFPSDARIRECALGHAHTLPHALRSVIVAAAGVGADRHAVLRETLAAYDTETDFQLRVQLSIDHHRLRRTEGDVAAVIDHLDVELDRPGMDIEDRRTTIFAGLVVLGRPEAILTVERLKAQVSIQSLFGGASAAFCSLIVEHWGELKQALGTDFVEKIIKTGRDTCAWPALSRYIAADVEARRDFLDWCASTEHVGFTALRSLAEFWPRSEVLKTHVLRGLEASGVTRSQEEGLTLVVTAAEILRDQFLTDELRFKVKTRFEKSRELYAAVALSIIDPSEPALRRRTRASLDIGREGGLWLAAVQIAARLDPPDEVVAVIRAMAERDARPGREGQALMTSVLIDRLSRDPAAADTLAAGLKKPLSPSALAASVSLLSSAGRLDAEGWLLCQQKANAAFVSSVPIAALDIQRDQLRPLAHILADILLPQAF